MNSAKVAAPMHAVLRARPALELGLGLCVFIFLPLLALFPRGVAGLAGIAGLLAFGIAAPDDIAPWRGRRPLAALLAALLVWGLISALWAIDPVRGLTMEARLLGLFAAGLALLAAAPLVVAPGRLLAWLCAGLALALVLTVVQAATAGALTHPFLEHIFIMPRLNQVEVALVLVLPPVTATLVLQGRYVAAVLVAEATGAVIFGLVGDAARDAFLIGIACAPLIFLWQCRFARLAAAGFALVTLVAPLVFPMLIRSDAIGRWARAAKFSLWHRIEIWSFVGGHIAARPVLGWGLDSSRSIPGGSAPTPDGVPWLPLHPHNVTLQVWLELGMPGAVLFAVFIARVWLAFGAVRWPRLYAAAAGASLAAASVVALGTYGLWQEWWIGTEFLALFLILVMARLAAPSK